MIPIVLIGGRKQNGLARMMSGALAGYGKVALCTPEAVAVDDTGGADFLLDMVLRPAAVHAKGGVMVIAELPGRYSVPDLSDGIITVMDAEHKKAIRLLGGMANTAVCCGMSGRDTLTLSSLREDGAMVCLQRDLTSLTGEVIEPCDIPVKTAARYSERHILFTAAVLLACGCIPGEEGYSF